MAARAKATSDAARLLRLWVRIPPRAMMSVSCKCCVVRQRSLRRADHSSRGVLTTAVRRWVWSRNRMHQVIAQFGPQRHKYIYIYIFYTNTTGLLSWLDRKEAGTWENQAVCVCAFPNFILWNDRFSERPYYKPAIGILMLYISVHL